MEIENPSAETIFTSVAALTTAQQTMLTRVAKHQEPVTISEIAKELGLHQNSVRATLDSLFAAGLVDRRQNPIQGRGRPSWGYFAIAPLDDSFVNAQLVHLCKLLVAVVDERSDNPEAEANEIGRSWADRILRDDSLDDAQKPSLVSVPESEQLCTLVAQLRTFLSQLGYSATIAEGDEPVVELRFCPFTDADGSVDPLLCHLHAGMVQRLAEISSKNRFGTSVMPHIRPGVCAVAVNHN